MGHVVYLDAAVKELENLLAGESGYGNMDDWLPVGEIEKVKVG